ncbi:MAG: TIGR02300 family protein [Bauldia sp.]|nr:TIGR02300 family protein [Bauldia sp.]
MAKADLGTKRLCPNCGAKYYDLNHDPILCPRCGTQFEVHTGKSRPAPARAVVEDEEEVEAAEGPEIISLEEADAEAGEGADDEEIEGDDGADDTFLEPDEEEEGDDVGDIIGDVDEEER